MEEFKINIAEDFSKTPGGRWKDLGPYSGQEFYDNILLPKFKDAVENSDKLHVYLDGVKSYPHSFLDQSFGELARTYNKKTVNERIVFHASEKLWVVNYIKDKIWQL